MAASGHACGGAVGATADANRAPMCEKAKKRGILRHSESPAGGRRISLHQAKLATLCSESARANALKDALAQIAALKSSVTSPQQVVRELPKYLPLPQPIQITTPQASPPGDHDPQKGSGAPEKSAESPVTTNSLRCHSEERAAGGRRRIRLFFGFSLLPVC